jgi:nitrogen fixation NifU-like protein
VNDTTESMYQEIILDHYRNPHHKGLRDPFDVEVHHVNPTRSPSA